LHALARLAVAIHCVKLVYKNRNSNRSFDGSEVEQHYSTKSSFLFEGSIKFHAGLDTAPRQPRIDAMDTTLNSRLSMITLPDVDGTEIRFGSLWIRQPAVVVFLRHYG